MTCLPFFFLLLSVTSLVGAQTVSQDPDVSANRPLNLSVRQPEMPVSNATVTSLPPAPDAVTPLSYGSGFESRQQGGEAGNGNGNKGSGGNAGSGSGSGGGSGKGGGGRGGSGRGR